MPSTVFDSFYFKDRFGTQAMRDIWSDRATIGRWLEVEAALAAVEAELGLVPAKAAREIERKARVENLDLRSMKRGFDRTWNPVVPLLDELRKKLSPEARGVLHWGATSKNIFDTGLVLDLGFGDAGAVAAPDVGNRGLLLAGELPLFVVSPRLELLHRELVRGLRSAMVGHGCILTVFGKHRKEPRWRSSS